MLAVGEGAWDEQQSSRYAHGGSFAAGSGFSQPILSHGSRPVDRRGGVLGAPPTMAAQKDAPEVDAGLEAAEGTQEQPELGGSGQILQVDRFRDVASSRNGPSHPACGSTWACFFYGYRDGDGYYSEERIDAMIQCESSWRIDPGGYHYGLAQFDPGTWATVSAITGLTDWRDPYQQGYNVAVWASMVSPGTTAGWPYCWWAY